MGFDRPLNSFRVMSKKDFTEKNFVLNHLTDEEKEYAENYNNPKKIHVTRKRLLASDITLVVAVLTIIGALFTGYSFVKEQGARDNEINSLLDKKNPVVKRQELKSEIKSVRHDMAVGDTMVILKNDSKYKLIEQHIESIDKSMLEMKKADLEQKKANSENMTLIIELLKNQKK